MINIKEIQTLNKNTAILICDLFDDKIITNTLKSDIGTHKDFEVEKTKECFSVPKTRNIVIFGNQDYSKIKNIEFV